MADAPSRRTSTRSIPQTGKWLELAVLTGMKLPPTSSVWYVAELTSRRPFRSTNVLPVPRFRRLNAPKSPRPEFTPPEIFSASLKKFCPFSGISASSSSPESTPMASMASASSTLTASASDIDAPLICEPTTITSSSAVSSSCANVVADRIAIATAKGARANSTERSKDLIMDFS